MRRAVLFLLFLVLCGAALADGEKPATPPDIVYPRAIYKPSVPKAKSLDEFIRSDIAEFMPNAPGITVDKLPPLQDGDGKSLPYYSIQSQDAGHWKLVAYGETGDYYLIFAVSGKTREARDAMRRNFEDFISRYKEPR